MKGREERKRARGKKGKGRKKITIQLMRDMIPISFLHEHVTNMSLMEAGTYFFFN